MSGRKPLTLEELRGMDGKQVWCEPLKDWAKVFKFGIMFFGTEDGCTWKEITETYGKDWLAYAYEPTRIDRSAWEPCEYCNGKRTLYQKTRHTRLYMDTFGAASTLVTECSCCPPYVKCCMKDIPANSAFKINFCPECGRPLTDAAWEMLERRLAGHENQ